MASLLTFMIHVPICQFRAMSDVIISSIHRDFYQMLNPRRDRCSVPTAPALGCLDIPRLTRLLGYMKRHAAIAAFERTTKIMMRLFLSFLRSDQRSGHQRSSKVKFCVKFGHVGKQCWASAFLQCVPAFLRTYAPPFWERKNGGTQSFSKERK